MLFEPVKPRSEPPVPLLWRKEVAGNEAVFASERLYAVAQHPLREFLMHYGIGQIQRLCRKVGIMPRD